MANRQICKQARFLVRIWILYYFHAFVHASTASHTPTKHIKEGGEKIKRAANQIPPHAIFEEALNYKPLNSYKLLVN